MFSLLPSPDLLCSQPCSSLHPLSACKVQGEATRRTKCPLHGEREWQTGLHRPRQGSFAPSVSSLENRAVTQTSPMNETVKGWQVDSIVTSCFVWTDLCFSFSWIKLCTYGVCFIKTNSFYQCGLTFLCDCWESRLFNASLWWSSAVVCVETHRGSVWIRVNTVTAIWHLHLSGYQMFNYRPSASTLI